MNTQTLSDCISIDTSTTRFLKSLVTSLSVQIPRRWSWRCPPWYKPCKTDRPDRIIFCHSGNIKELPVLLFVVVFCLFFLWWIFSNNPYISCQCIHLLSTRLAIVSFSQRTLCIQGQISSVSQTWGSSKESFWAVLPQWITKNLIVFRILVSISQGLSLLV